MERLQFSIFPLSTPSPSLLVGRPILFLIGSGKKTMFGGMIFIVPCSLIVALEVDTWHDRHSWFSAHQYYQFDFFYGGPCMP